MCLPARPPIVRSGRYKAARGFRLLRSRLLAYPLTLDIIVSFFAYAIHWGTFTGVMAAAVAALMCSGFTAVARWLFGWIDRRGYHRGVISIQLR